MTVGRGGCEFSCSARLKLAQNPMNNFSFFYAAKTQLGISFSANPFYQQQNNCAQTMAAEVAVMAGLGAQKVKVTCEQNQPKKLLTDETGKIAEQQCGENVIGDDPKPAMLVEKSSSYREESNFLSDLKESERKALIELKSKVEEALLGNSLFNDEKREDKEKQKQDQNEPSEGCPDGPKAAADEVAAAAKEESTTQVKNGGADVSLWGVPLLPSKGSEGTDIILLKFLRAREFKVNDTFEMLKKTLIWRKNLKIDSKIIYDDDDEDKNLGADLASAAYMNGFDRQGHPVCYNIFEVFSNEDLYNAAFGTEEKCENFLKWRFQLMEEGIKKLDFQPGGVTSILQVYDLKNCPGPSKKMLRTTTFKAIGLLQDNYPELVAKNVIVNVPFWYYAFYALISPFLTQRSKSKFVVARPAKVTETLLKYIPLEEIPTQYGGFKRDKDSEFSNDESEVSELFIKAGSSETIEIPAFEVGNTIIWDLTVLGWEVNFKEEFVPEDEGSYTVIVRKQRKMSCFEGPIRNSFRNNERGKIIVTIANTSGKKKRVFFRYTIKKDSSLSP